MADAAFYLVALAAFTGLAISSGLREGYRGAAVEACFVAMVCACGAIGVATEDAKPSVSFLAAMLLWGAVLENRHKSNGPSNAGTGGE